VCWVTEESWFDPFRAKKYFFYPKCQDRIWFLPSSMWIEEAFSPALSSKSVLLITNLYPESMLGQCTKSLYSYCASSLYISVPAASQLVCQEPPSYGASSLTVSVSMSPCVCLPQFTICRHYAVAFTQNAKCVGCLVSVNFRATQSDVLFICSDELLGFVSICPWRLGLHIQSHIVCVNHQFV
jgi:hypothetical protein